MAVTRTIGRMPVSPAAVDDHRSPTSPQRPRVKDVARPPSRYRDRDGRSLLESPTPEELKSARQQAQAGRPKELFRILRFFRDNDSEIPGAMRSLISAVTQSGLAFEADEESDEAARQEAFLRRVFDELDLTSMIETLLEGHYYGFSAPISFPKAAWQGLTVGAATYMAPLTYEELPHEWLYAEIESIDRRGRAGTGAGDDYRTLFVGAAPYHTYGPGSLLVYTSRKLTTERHLDFTTFGAGLAAARFGIFEWFNVEDWAAANEAFGTPSIIGTLLQGWSDRDYDLLKEAIWNLSSDSRAIVTDRTSIDIKGDPFRASTTGSYDKLLEAACRAKARIIKSESLTDNMRDRGSYAAMVTTNGIRLDVARYLARRVERLVNRRLVYPLLDLNFPRRLVRWQLRVREVSDPVQIARTFREAQTLGLDLSASQVRSDLSLRRPEGEEDTLRAGGTFNPFAGA